MKLWGHTLVCNEERYLWFSVTSVIDCLDKLLLWDTGSTDNTVQIIKELRKSYPDKILFREVGKVGKDDFTKVRQKMLEETKGDWFLILDGDEVWWKEGIGKIRRAINEKGDSVETVVNGYYNLIGDIYHYQPESSGRYEIDGKVGHITIRVINRGIPGLNFSKPHGQQGIFDGSGTLIQERDRENRLFLGEKMYLHFTHLVRSQSLIEDRKIIKRDIKYKYEIGKMFPPDFYFPESFFLPCPNYIKSPWGSMDTRYLVKAAVQTPLKRLKRKLNIWEKSGY